MIVVSDTGPINYLLIINRIELLPRLFKTVVFPPAVIDELSDADAPAKVQRWAGNLPAWARVQIPTQADQSIFPVGRGRGEREAINSADCLNIGGL